MLFHLTDYSGWMVGNGERAVDCHGIGCIKSLGNVCAASPDGCDGRWQEGCDVTWCDSPDLLVGPADAVAVAAAEEAASWRRTVAILIAALGLMFFTGWLLRSSAEREGWMVD